MRYYNEDPQVKFWREKHDSLKNQNEELKNDIAHLELMVNRLVNEKESYKKQADILTDKIESFKQDIQFLNKELYTTHSFRKSENEIYTEFKSKMIRGINYFNALPWYKKMMYKFKI